MSHEAPPVGVVLWAGNDPDHEDHLHVEPPTIFVGYTNGVGAQPPTRNPGMTAGVGLIFDALEARYGPGEYFLDSSGRYVGNDPGIGWTHMGGWNRRPIADSLRWSNHAWWNALDVGPLVGVAAQLEVYRFLTGQEDHEMPIDRSTTADAGNPDLEATMAEAVRLGVASEHTQPGGVAFNDEVVAFVARAAGLDARAELAALNKKVNAVAAGGGVTVAAVIAEIIRRLAS